MRSRFRGIASRQGVVFEVAGRWGEFCPFPEYGDDEARAWLQSALEQSADCWPSPVRDRIPVNCIIPAVNGATAWALTASSGCRTAKVKVADLPDSLGADIARVEAVRDALGGNGKIRIDANGAWDVDDAVRHIRLLDRAAQGLEYVEQPCRSIEDMAAVRRRVTVRVAADESIRRAADPLRVSRAGAADVAVVKCAPLGGVRRALEVVERIGLPCVVSSALETSVGLAAEVALAAALPDLDFACGLDTLTLIDGDLVTEENAIRPVDGVIHVSGCPPTPDPAMLQRYTMTDPDQERFWLMRLRRLSLQ